MAPGVGGGEDVAMNRNKISSLFAVAVAAVAALVVLVGSAGAADAAVRVVVSRTGDLIITGDGQANSILIVDGEDVGELGVIVDGEPGDPVDFSLAVTRNVRVSLGAGADELTVGPGVSLPGGLVVSGGSAGSGTDRVELTGATVSGVASIRFVGAGSVLTGDTTIGKTLVVRGGSGDFQFCDGVCAGTGGSNFEQNVRITGGRSGGFAVTTASTTEVASRFTVIGGRQGATLTLTGNLGLNPILRTLNGDDRWLIDGATWTGKLRGITSTGDDAVSLVAPAGPGPGPLLFNVNLGGGDDLLGVDAGFDPLSRANGTGGRDTICDLSGVLAGTFETVDRSGCSILVPG